MLTLTLPVKYLLKNSGSYSPFGKITLSLGLFESLILNPQFSFSESLRYSGTNGLINQSSILRRFTFR